MKKEEVVNNIETYFNSFNSEITDSVDPRLTEYIIEVLRNPDDHGKYEILSIFRFLDFLGKYELKKKKVRKYIAFYESLSFPSAKGMQSFRLTPIQVFQFTNILGFYNGDKRVCRDALLFVPRKFSKELALDTKIPTPNGWKTMGDLQVGDYVFDENGQPTRITEVSEVKYNKKCYELTFSDGDKITASDEHMWWIRYFGRWQELTTQEIVDRNWKTLRKGGKYYNYNAFVPQAKGIKLPEIELPFDPYTFGLWLGDGNSASPILHLCGDDIDEILSYVEEKGITPKSIVREKEENCFRCYFTRESNNPSEFSKFLTNYNLKGDKHIPEIFFNGSLDQRLELLQGIMDTDGSIMKKKGTVYITQKNDKLTDDICRLLTSVGIKYKRSKQESKIGTKSCGYYNYITFHPTTDTPCFKLERKKKYLDNSNVNDTKSIVDIKEVPSVPCKCISVDNPKHLYICGERGTVTHNTTTVSSLAIFDLLFGDSDAQAYVASNSLSQSNICFIIIKNTLKELDPTFSNFRLNRDIIYTKIPGRSSFIRCLASSADKLDGLNASTVILDEYAQADTAALRNVLTSSMGVRKNPLVITITTASTKLDTPFVSMLNNYKKILDREIENDSIFASIFEPDEGDDPGDERTWKKVQPHLGVTVTLDFYKSEYQKTLISADDKTEFMCKLLNVFSVPLDKQWIDHKVIERNTGDFDLTKLQARPQCMVSVDLSVKDDFSCVCYALYDSINKRFVFKNDYYIPRNTIKNHHNSEMYTNLVNSGHLKVCGEDVIDYSQIANDIISNSKYVNILQLGYDAYKSKELTNILRASGLKTCIPYSQTYANFTSPIESFEAAIYQDRLKFDSNPLNLYCIKNCIIDEDRMCNKKPIKKTHNLKIDGAICILMCIGMFSNYKR